MSLLTRRILDSAATLARAQTRSLNLLEYQAKGLLEDYGVTVQRFKVASSAEEAAAIPPTFPCSEYVVKAQVLAGGRGKGTFDNGFQGGVHLTKDPSLLTGLCTSMLGQRLVTKQTPPEGITVTKVMVAEAIDIARETYFCIAMDRASGGVVLVASPDGGVDIEEVAARSPERLLHLPVDIHTGVTREVAEQVADFLGFQGDLVAVCADQIQALYAMFLDVDCLQLEVYTADAKLGFDDNASFRQKAIFAMEDTAEVDPREADAARHGLNYVQLGGNIGCLVNGAGLAMATMDIVQLHGGRPANFLDVGGGVQEAQVREAFRIITEDKGVKAILVNIFGGIVDCATVARGIVAACRASRLEVPLVVRLEGNNVEEARRIVEESGLAVMAADLADAAEKACAALN